MYMIFKRRLIKFTLKYWFLTHWKLLPIHLQTFQFEADYLAALHYSYFSALFLCVCSYFCLHSLTSLLYCDQYDEFLTNQWSKIHILKVTKVPAIFFASLIHRVLLALIRILIYLVWSIKSFLIGNWIKTLIIWKFD